MVIEKDKKLKRKALMNGYCRICNKPIHDDDIKNGNFEYVKSKVSENFFHSKCVKKEIEGVRKRNRSKTKKQC